MSGQYWPEGDEVYHAELTVPILLVHGMCDKFVPMDEDQRMAEVQYIFIYDDALLWLLCVIVTFCKALHSFPSFCRSSCLHS